MATTTVRQSSAHAYLPREHGATAMMLTPFFCAAILLRHVYWQEAVALVAIVVALVIKDPLVVIARQRWIWKQKHAETDAARRAAVTEILLLAAAGAALLLSAQDWHPLTALFVASAAFTVLAVAVNVQNRQRSVWFQVVSAVALSGTSIAACLAGPGRVPAWCWMIWGLCALQATAGIFVVHARLDARVASRKGGHTHSANRGAAILVQVILMLTAATFSASGRYWIAAALAVAACFYLLDLRRQRASASLQMSLKSVGQQALTLSIAFAILIIIGLW